MPAAPPTVTVSLVTSILSSIACLFACQLAVPVRQASGRFPPLPMSGCRQDTRRPCRVPRAFVLVSKGAHKLGSVLRAPTRFVRAPRAAYPSCSRYVRPARARSERPQSRRRLASTEAAAAEPTAAAAAATALISKFQAPATKRVPSSCDGAAGGGSTNCCGGCRPNSGGGPHLQVPNSGDKATTIRPCGNGGDGGNCSLSRSLLQLSVRTESGRS